MINIFVDSTSDLSPELVKKYNFHVLPLYVFVNNQSFRDRVDLTLDDLFRMIDQTGQLAKTSAVTVGDFAKAFQIPGENLFIGISSKLSATYQSACTALQTLGTNHTRLIDSLTLSTGIALLAIQAAELRDQGCTLDEIAAQVQAAVPKVHVSFTIETLEYLYKGGRCSAMQSIVGSLLQIRPVIETRPDGTLGIKSKTRGSRQKALSAMLEDMRSHLGEIDPARVFVTHTGCDKDAEYMAGELRKMADFGEVITTYAGSVIASHCGRDTIGLIYKVK